MGFLKNLLKRAEATETATVLLDLDNAVRLLDSAMTAALAARINAEFGGSVRDADIEFFRAAGGIYESALWAIDHGVVSREHMNKALDDGDKERLSKAVSLYLPLNEAVQLAGRGIAKALAVRAVGSSGYFADEDENLARRLGGLIETIEWAVKRGDVDTNALLDGRRSVRLRLGAREERGIHRTVFG